MKNEQYLLKAKQALSRAVTLLFVSAVTTLTQELLRVSTEPGCYPAVAEEVGFEPLTQELLRTSKH